MGLFQTQILHGEKRIKLRAVLGFLALLVVVLTILGGLRLTWLRRIWGRLQFGLWLYVVLVLTLAVAWTLKDYLFHP